MPDPLALTLVGGPTLLVELGGLRLLTDPTFDPPRSASPPGSARPSRAATGGSGR